MTDITKIAENEGNQLFCIIPTDETVTVTVYQFGLNEANLPEIGEEVYEKNIDFEWGMSAGVIRLQHVGGDLLMPGTKGETFEFWGND